MIRSKKHAGKQVKFYESEGLFLLVTPQGGKYFRFKYRFDVKEKLLALVGGAALLGAHHCVASSLVMCWTDQKE